MSREVLDLTIDTSAVLAVILNEPTRQDLIRASNSCELIAPGSLSWEVGNALSALFKKRRLDLSQAVQAVASYRLIPVRLIDTELEVALELASQLRIYAYDAYMLECARRFRTPLLTLDRRLQLAARKIGISVLEVGG